MKIDNSNTPLAGARPGATRSAAADKSAAAAPSGGGASVQLSGASAQLQSSSDASVYDAARVSQIKQAISDGKFQINAGAIADRLISSARELVDAERRG